MDFSVLVSVYRGETPAWLDGALESLEMQTALPSEIVVVKDGPLTPELEEVLDRHVREAPLRYVTVSLEENRGLGVALDEGLKHCSCEWVARMDADDIALPDRFEKQTDYLEAHPGLDIAGGWICEFDEDAETGCIRERRVPSGHEEISRFARYRNPMNHMTVMFRKKAVEEAGGYRPMEGFEDYFLWMRMLAAGKRFGNLSEILVKARAGRGMIGRRQGWRYAAREWRFGREAYRMGFWSFGDLARNFFLRVLPRLLPPAIVEKLYNLLRKF